MLLGPKASKTMRGVSLPLTATAPRSRYRTRVADRACGGGDMCETSTSFLRPFRIGSAASDMPGKGRASLV